MNKELDKDVIKEILLSVLNNASEDKSWRVRLNLAKKFSLISESFGNEIINSSLIQIFSTLLKDVEVEVRIAATSNIRSILNNLTVEKINTYIIPNLTYLYNDTNPHVKSGLAAILGDICVIIGKEGTENKLFSIAVELMKDNDTDVKVEII